MVFQKKPELREENVLRRIFELRNQGQGFNNIAKMITQEFGIDVTHPTTKNLYYEYAAKQKLKETTGESTALDWNQNLKDKFSRIEKITNSLLDAVEIIKDKLTPELYLKHAPTIISILRESLNQLMFIRREQEQITIKQQNLIYSPLQIIQEISRLEQKDKEDKEYLVISEKKEEDEDNEEKEEFF